MGLSAWRATAYAHLASRTLVDLWIDGQFRADHGLKAGDRGLPSTFAGARHPDRGRQARIRADAPEPRSSSRERASSRRSRRRGSHHRRVPAGRSAGEREQRRQSDPARATAGSAIPAAGGVERRRRACAASQNEIQSTPSARMRSRLSRIAYATNGSRSVAARSACCRSRYLPPNLRANQFPDGGGGGGGGGAVVFTTGCNTGLLPRLARIHHAGVGPGHPGTAGVERVPFASLGGS